MAKKKLNIDRSRDTDIVLSDYEIEKETSDIISSFVANPTSESNDKIKEAINKDNLLDIESKKQLLSELNYVLNDVDNSYKNIPEDYTSLKSESIVLAGLTEKSLSLSYKTFIHLCKRLKVIKEKHLYKKFDNYLYFKDFFTHELNISKSTAYEYIALIEQFEESARADSDLETLAENRTKVRAFIPIMKSERLSKKEKTKIAINLFDKIANTNRSELIKEAEQIKLKKGIIKKEKKNEMDEEINKIILEIRSKMKKGFIPKITWEKL